MSDHPLVEMVSGIGLAAALLDGDVDEVHPAGDGGCFFLEAVGQNGLLVLVIHVEVELDELDETPGTQGLHHFVDQTLVVADLRSSKRTPKRGKQV